MSITDVEFNVKFSYAGRTAEAGADTVLNNCQTPGCENNLITNGDFDECSTGNHPLVNGWSEIFPYDNGRYNFVCVPPNNAISTTEPQYTFCVPTPTTGNYIGFG
ncbi:MAG: hypothetical protein IPL53_00165 [Ignavibacteria bacterium]|nr:hypothetical protein [Ignavibacteria bacterium]